MKDKGVGVGMHYPIPIHKQEAFFNYNIKSFNNAECLSTKQLSLPIFSEMTYDQIRYVSNVLLNYF